jgi:hypothetical protein
LFSFLGEISEPLTGSINSNTYSHRRCNTDEQVVVFSHAENNVCDSDWRKVQGYASGENRRDGVEVISCCIIS